MNIEALSRVQLEEYKNFINYLAGIKADWEYFVTTGKTDRTTLIRPEVLSSWIRSRERGVSPHDFYPISLTPKRLKQKLEETRELTEIASPFLEALVSNVEGSGFRVDLLDKELYIIKQFGEPEVLDTARKQGSYPGVSRSEQNTGTNAINLAAILGRPIQLMGPEHYNAKLQYWTCSATPLFDESGELLGVVNMAGPYRKVHKHTLGMVIALGRAIEFSWRQNRLRREKELTAKYIEGIVNSISEGLVALDGQGRITVLNRTAGRLLDINPKDALYQPAGDIFGRQSTIAYTLKTGEPVVDSELIFFRRNSRKIMIGNTLPVVNGGKVNGVLAVFRGLSHARGFVKNLAGFKAYFTFEHLKGNDPRFVQVINLARQAASLPSNILLMGESGTGKEMFAQSIHNASSSSSGPFVGINCAAIPTELIESELFGYEGGAFTGAKREGQPGKFQLAESGTLFLDEVSAMPVTMQAKLLRVLQNRSFTRVGGNGEIPFRARIIAAANCDLWEEVRQGNFREDLFYRLNVITIDIPPLRERKADIPVLIRHFCQKHSERLNFQFAVPDRVTELALSYHWPGNVRELENVIERSAVLAYSRGSRYIGEQDLLSYPGFKKTQASHENPPDNGFFPPSVGNLETMERQAVKNALHQAAGNISKAARELGITRKTLYNKIKKYNIKLP